MAKIMTNIASALTSRAQSNPYQQAVLAPAGKDYLGRRSYAQLSYKELDELSTQTASGLKKEGLERGQRTVLMVPPGIEFYVLTFALFKLGAIPVMADPGMGVKNLKKCIEEAEPHAFIGTEKAHLFRVLFRAGIKKIKVNVHLGRGLFRNSISYQDLAAKGRQGPQVLMGETKLEDTAAILFTSGSTGVPKGVIYSHRIFISQVNALEKMYRIKSGERDLPTFPLFGLFGPALGMTEIIPDMNPSKPASVDPQKIIEAINGFGVTNIFGSPALINRVGRYGEAHAIKLPSIKRVISAGAPVPPAILERFCKMLNKDVEIHTPYGATEALPVSTIGSSAILRETSFETNKGAGICVGHPVNKNEVKVIEIKDEVINNWSDSLVVGTGIVGEVVVRGDIVTSGYFNREGSTRLAKIYLNGDKKVFFHRMGDVGYLDDSGRLWFCGRKSHRVVTETGTLFTIQCEAIFNTHPSVYRTALVGVKKGKKLVPVLCVEPEKSEKGHDLQKLKKELLSIGSKHSYTKNIKSVIFHPSFPVDVRHNAKIFREKLALIATKKIRIP